MVAYTEKSGNDGAVERRKKVHSFRALQDSYIQHQIL
jgi:hypothetical protein